MVQSVELLLDLALERHIIDEWGQLVGLGLPSQGRHSGASNRPHVTLAVAPQLTTQDEAEIVAAARDAVPLRVRLGGLLVFGSGSFVLARAVVPNFELLELQQRIAERLPFVASRSDHQRVGSWSAHVTLARRLDADQLAAAVVALSPITELVGQAAAIRRWDGDRKVDWLIA